MIKVTDVAYARFRAPDLDKMEGFLKDFGLVRSARTDKALYMRACDANHHVHITEVGDPAFIGMAFHAASEDDLHALSKFAGTPRPREIKEPGGGKKVQLTDPDGFLVEVVHGIEGLEPIESEELLEELFGVSEDPSIVYEHVWNIGDLVIWDNRCITHARTDFPENERRLLRRTTIVGKQEPS